MLAALGMLGGKAIGKYIAMGAAIVAVGFGLWLMVQSYNKAIEKAAQGEIKLQRANSETESANANTEQVARMYATQKTQLESARRLSHQRAISRQQATAALALNLNSALPDFGSINGRLCEQLSRIQGSPVNGCPDMPEAGQAGSRVYKAIATIDQASIINLESTLRQCADYIESVENQPVNAEPDKGKDGNSSIKN